MAVYGPCRPVYTAVYRPCARPVCTASVHDCIRAVCTAVFDQWRTHGGVHGRLRTLVVYTTIFGRLHSAYTARVLGHNTTEYTGLLGPCTRPCTCIYTTGRVHSRPKRAYVYTAVTRPCTCRVHGCEWAVYTIFFAKDIVYAETYSYKSILHSKRVRTTSATSTALRSTTVLRSMLVMGEWTVASLVFLVLSDRCRSVCPVGL